MVAEKWFPIQSQRGARPHPLRVPWSVAELAYSVYAGMYGRSQSLEQLAARGGFGPGEMDDFLPGWRERCDEITQLRAVLASWANLAPQLAQLLDGWHQDGTAWSEWDESVRAYLSRAHAATEAITASFHRLEPT